MNSPYKPQGYNSLSPYLVIDGAQALIDLLDIIFGIEVLRRYERPDGGILHAEIRLDDTVLMVADANEQYPPKQHLLHVYVPDVDAVFAKALAAGCQEVQPPQQSDDDPDRRGMFADFAGNTWAVAAQAS